MNLETAASIVTAHLYRLRTGPDSIGGEPPEHAAIAYILGQAHKAAIYERDYRAALKREAELRRLLERCAKALADPLLLEAEQAELLAEIRGDLPPKSPPAAVLWDSHDNQWPLDDPDQRVTIIHADGSTEGATVRLVQAGETVDAMVGGRRVRGMVRRGA